ncbi:MAG: ABC transporter permease [Acidobacteriota bacterium]
MKPARVVSPAVWKEIRALLPIWAASSAALATAVLWPEHVPTTAGLLAYLLGSAAIGTQSIGHEYTCGTLPMLLSQPDARPRLYLRKLGVSAVMLLTLAALAWRVPVDALLSTESRVILVMVPLLCGLFLAPLLTMTCRSPLVGFVLGTWWPGMDADTPDDPVFGRWARGMIVLSLLAGVVVWRRFTRLEATEGGSLALHLPRWFTRANGARAHGPLMALAAKEVQLHSLAFVAAGCLIPVLALLLLAQRFVSAWSSEALAGVTLLYCMGLAITIGARASAEERQHRTLDWQRLQPTPAWQQWLVKVGVTLALALLFGVGVPVLLIQLTTDGGPRFIGLSGDLAVVVLLLTAASVYVSSLSTSGVCAMMVLSLPVGFAVAALAHMAQAAQWAALKLAGPWMDNLAAETSALSSVDPPYAAMLVARILTLTLVPLLLWFGFVHHTSSERPTGRMVQQIASVALLLATSITAAGGVLAYYELGSR